MKKAPLLGSALVFLLVPFISSAAVLGSQTITLAQGWNIVSTPMVLSSHSFSATENSTNFDIYVLDASQTSGWATMAQEGQTEFTPLYGYFVDNKTGTTQTLTLNYLASTTPNQRLFERKFNAAGWYSIGVSNPNYALSVTSATTTDTNNPSSILSALSGAYDTLVDLTDGLFGTDVRSVAVASSWKAVTSSDSASLHDLRETKGYAVHISSASGLYDGYQNDALRTHTLTYATGANGSVTGATSQTINDGENGTPVTAVPSSGYQFASWSDGSTSNPRTDTNVTGDISVTASFNLPTAAAITMASTPASQNVIAGTSAFTFANINIDASNSGEDVRVNSLKVSFAGSASDLSACQLYDGSTALNTGSNVLNSLSTSGANSLVFDNSLTISKGTVKTLALKCNISSGAQNGDTYVFGINSSYGYTAVGTTSGTSFTPTITTATGGTMTVTSGSLAISVDASSPSYGLAAAGTTGVTMGVVKFRASNEAMSLQKLGLTVSNGTYGSKATGSGGSASGAGDVVQAYIYNGSTLVGTAIFTGSNTTATSTLSTPVTLAKDSDTTLTLKADLAAIGTSASGGIGDVIKLDPLNAQAVGQSSGTTVNAGASTGVAGVQLYKTYPTVAFVSNATNPNGTNATLKRFTITANSSGSLGLYQISASVATSSASVTNLKLFAYTDSGYSVPASVSGTTGGQFGTTQTPNASSYTSVFTQTSPLQVAAGTTLYFAIVGDVTPNNSATNWAVSTTILGDSAATAAPAGYNVNTASSVSPANFVWSDNATTTASQTDIDWTNGYAVSGLPASGF